MRTNRCPRCGGTMGWPIRNPFSKFSPIMRYCTNVKCWYSERVGAAQGTATKEET